MSSLLCLPPCVNHFLPGQDLRFPSDFGKKPTPTQMESDGEKRVTSRPQSCCEGINPVLRHRTGPGQNGGLRLDPSRWNGAARNSLGVREGAPVYGSVEIISAPAGFGAVRLRSTGDDRKFTDSAVVSTLPPVVFPSPRAHRAFA